MQDGLSTYTHQNQNHQWLQVELGSTLSLYWSHWWVLWMVVIEFMEQEYLI